MKVWLIQNYMTFYYLILAMCLIGLNYSLKRIKYDERRRSRNFITKIKINNRFKFIEKMKNDEYDEIFEEVGIHRYLKSEWYNGIRLGVYVIAIVSVSLNILLNVEILTYSQAFLLFMLGFMMIPKKPYPAYHLFNLVQKSYNTKKNAEVYQLYNDIKAEYMIKGDKVGNMYHLIMRLLPYYENIKLSLEKILPYLQRQDSNTAWELFAKQINTKEAESLSIVLRDIEKISIEESILVLESKHEEFANNLYNAYKEYLSRRRWAIYGILIVGALSVFKYEWTVFFLWYKDIMNVVNNIS
ncbi:hypothetical protein [Gottfriedia solisilvae]|uniref:hypothetical protein n=1 Tax=Gottfriedia solisilvae TaxID=1516104 RepID=UPI003D2EFE6D